MVRFIRKRYMLILTVLLLFLFLATTFNTTTVKDFNLVIGLGIDQTAEGYEVSTQLTLPLGEETAKKSDIKFVLSAKGATVHEALYEIKTMTGMYLDISHCNILIIGREAAGHNVIDALDYLIRSEILKDSAMIAISEKTAKEVLETKVPLDDLSAYSLQKIILNNYPALSVAKSTIKDFQKSYYSKENSGYATMIKIVDLPHQAIGAIDNPEDKEVIFDCTSTALFADKKLAGELDAKQTQALNYMCRSVNKGALTIKNVQFQDDICDLSIEINGKRQKNYFYFSDSVPVFETNIKVYVKVSEVINADSATKSYYDHPNNFNYFVKGKIESAIKNEVENLWNYIQERDCDIMRVTEYFYRLKNAEYLKFIKGLDDEREFFHNVRFKASVSAVISDSNQK